MNTYKWSIAHTIFILTLIAALGCSSFCAIAADEVVPNTAIASKMDAIGLEYSLAKDGSAITTFNVNSEDMTIVIMPWKDKGSLAICSLYEKEGIHSLRCIVTPECQGAEFKSAIFSFVSAMNEFQSAQQKYTKEFSAGENTTTAQATASPTLTDFNIIPAQYREAETKVKAWLKQQGYYGKTVSIKAKVGSVYDNGLQFIYYYTDTQDLSSYLDIYVVPNNYSPLDYNENDVYIISGQITDKMFCTFQLSNPILQRAK